MTAVLAPNMAVQAGYNGVYTITGFVNSQNSYDAFISTDFTANAAFNNGIWNIYNVKVGVGNAKAYAKNFTQNWVALMALCGGVGLLFFLLINLLI